MKGPPVAACVKSEMSGMTMHRRDEELYDLHVRFADTVIREDQLTYDYL